MSHNIEHYSYHAEMPKGEISKGLNEYARVATAGEGGSGLYSPIRFMEDHICDSWSDAKRYLEQMDRGNYDQLAVRYRELPEDVSSSALDSLREQRKKVSIRFRTESERLVIKEAKSLRIGCKHCGSQLTRSFLASNFCPVCHTDLRSPTQQNKIQRLREKVEELDKKIEAESAKLRAKHGKLKWLVKIEYHT